MTYGEYLQSKTLTMPMGASSAPIQLSFFDRIAEPPKSPDEDNFDYEADDAEAVVYLIFESGQYDKSDVYVMKRSDAVAFCSHPKTCGQGRGGGWAFAFTTHRRDWRDTPDTFRDDDGRFDWLFDELGIKLIHRVQAKKYQIA